MYHVTTAGSLGGQLKYDNQSINQSINHNDREYSISIQDTLANEPEKMGRVLERALLMYIM